MTKSNQNLSKTEPNFKLKTALKSLPNSPGVYQYFDKFGKLLYVGKAKVLKNRVKSYFIFSPELGPNPRLSPRIAKMINETAHLEYIATSSEADALILENSFIKQLHPKYNILLRDDKTYPYIFIDLNEKFPRPKITRKIIKGSKIRYFGPFHQGAQQVLDAIYAEFKLVQNPSCIKGKKACIFAQMNRCYAPCEGKISEQDYAKIVFEAMAKLKDPSRLIPHLEQKMQNYSLNQNYEQALAVREQIQAINSLKIKIQIDLAKLEDFEIFAVSGLDMMLACVHFSVRDGKVAFANHSIIKATNDDESVNELYKQSILGAYSQESPLACSQIFCESAFEDMELLGQILSARHGQNFEIKCPKIGSKRALVNIAKQNASELIKKQSKLGKYEFLEHLQEFFGLSNLPARIECFDNSCLFGTAVVGAMICFDINASDNKEQKNSSSGAFIKANYRHMHLNGQSDYEQMKELLSARASRFNKLSAPDLWLIDGGQALFDLAKKIIQESGANVDVLAIAKEKIDAKSKRAKGGALDKIHGIFGQMKLNKDDEKLQFLQKIRDEAHRFALSFHRKIRDKRALSSSKLEKLGLSVGNIKKLLDYFESYENIQNASFDELTRLTNKNIAKKIKGED